MRSKIDGEAIQKHLRNFYTETEQLISASIPNKEQNKAIKNLINSSFERTFGQIANKLFGEDTEEWRDVDSLAKESVSKAIQSLEQKSSDWARNEWQYTKEYFSPKT